MPSRAAVKNFIRGNYKKILIAVFGLAVPLVLGLLWVWILGNGLVASRQPVSEVHKPTGKLMRVARYYWPGQFWVEVADKKGWFKEAGLNVELVDTNADYYASQKDVIEGRLDTQDFYLYDLIASNIAGADLQMVMQNGQSAGAEGAVVRNNITNIQQLRGKKIGLTLDSNSDYLLYIFLKKNGLSVNDVTRVNMPAEKTLEAYTKGEVDGYVAYEPYLSQGTQNKGGRKLFDTADIPGVSVDGFSFRRTFIEERPGDVRAFVEVWDRTTEFIKSNPAEAFKIVAEVNKVTPGEVQAFTAQSKILDQRDNLTAFSYAAGFESLHGSSRQIGDFFLETKKINKPIDSTKFLDPQFIRVLR